MSQQHYFNLQKNLHRINFLWSYCQEPWVVCCEVEALKSSTVKMWQKQSLGRIEMKISSCLPTAQCVFCGPYLSCVKGYLCCL